MDVLPEQGIKAKIQERFDRLMDERFVARSMDWNALMRAVQIIYAARGKSCPAVIFMPSPLAGAYLALRIESHCPSEPVAAIETLRWLRRSIKYGRQLNPKDFPPVARKLKNQQYVSFWPWHDTSLSNLRPSPRHRVDLSYLRSNTRDFNDRFTTRDHKWRVYERLDGLKRLAAEALGCSETEWLETLPGPADIQGSDDQFRILDCMSFFFWMESCSLEAIRSFSSEIEADTGVEWAEEDGFAEALGTVRRQCSLVIQANSENLLILCARPNLIRTERTVSDRTVPHCEDGPCMVFPDGFRIHALHGMIVPAHFVEAPHTVATEDVLTIANAEVRRTVLEQIGVDAFIAGSGAVDIDSYEDRRGNPVRLVKFPGISLVTDLWEEEACHGLIMTNATRTAGAEQRRYLLLVPEIITSAKQAMAWTWGLEVKDYDPVAEA